MDAAVIVIEVAAPKPAEEHLVALVGACNRASEGAACVLAEHAPEEPPRAVAIVKGEGDHVRVELGLRRGVENEWHTREFDFEPHDEELERWRTVGFAIGTLAQSTRQAAEAQAQELNAPAAEPAVAPSPQPKPAPAETKEPERRRPARAPRSGAWFEGVVAAGPAFDPIRWRAGGLVRAGIELAPAGPFISASTFFFRSLPVPGSRLELEWLGLSGGLGLPILRLPAGQRLELRLESSLTRLQVSAHDAQGAVDRGQRWLVGGRCGADGMLPLTSWLGLVGVAEVTANAPTDIRIGGRHVGSAPLLGYGFALGARVRVR